MDVKEFASTPLGWAVIAVVAGGLLALGTTLTVGFIEEKGAWRTLGYVLALAALGGLGYAFNQYSGWISGLAVLAEIGLAVAILMAVCFPLALLVTFWRRRH
jgi:predicted membrane protein